MNAFSALKQSPNVALHPGTAEGPALKMCVRVSDTGDFPGKIQKCKNRAGVTQTTLYKYFLLAGMWLSVSSKWQKGSWSTALMWHSLQITTGMSVKDRSAIMWKRDLFSLDKPLASRVNAVSTGHWRKLRRHTYPTSVSVSGRMPGRM